MSPATSARRRSGPSKGDLREAAILETARRLFAAQPYESITVDDLAGAAGISRTSFYFYFPTKAAVLTALMARYWDALAAAQVWFDSSGPSPDLLRDQLRASARLWREHAGVLSCAPSAAASSAEMRDFLTRVKSRHNDRAADKIRRDQEQGSATTAIGATRLAEMIGAIRDACYVHLGDATDAELDKIVGDIATAVQRLLYEPV